MSLAIVVRDLQGDHRYGIEDLPLSVGGSEAQIDVPEVESAGALALLGISDEAPFVQPGPAGVPVYCNDRPIDTSRWLENGDSIRVGSIRIHCEFSPGRLDFRVHRVAPAGADLPEAEEIQPITYTSGAGAGGRWLSRVRLVPSLVVAFFLHSVFSASSSSARSRFS